MVSVLGVIGGVENDSGGEKTFWAHFGGGSEKKVVFVDLHTVNPIVNTLAQYWPSPGGWGQSEFQKDRADLFFSRAAGERRVL